MSEDLDGYGCEQGDYGYDAMHSGQVMIPIKINPKNGKYKIVKKKNLNSWFQFRGIVPGQQDNDFVLYGKPFSITGSGVSHNVVEYAYIAASYGYVV